MNFKLLTPLAVMLMSACASSPPPESLKNLYEVEHAARKLKPQSEVALLYLISTDNKQKGFEAALRINGELSMQRSFFDDQFYVFCLPPGKYDLVYRGDFLIPNKQEFLTAEPGVIYVRDFNQYAMMIVPFLPPLTGSNLRDTNIEAAKQLIAYKRIGTELEYTNSRYRCRSLD